MIIALPLACPVGIEGQHAARLPRRDCVKGPATAYTRDHTLALMHDPSYGRAQQSPMCIPDSALRRLISPLVTDERIPLARFVASDGFKAFGSQCCPFHVSPERDRVWLAFGA